jgi:hypothetical protein
MAHGSRSAASWQAGRRNSSACAKGKGLAEVFRITQGCVIEKADGTRMQVRNFDKGEPWMKGPVLQEIRSVLRSPLRAME